jgi:hypothetical protein
LAKGPYVIDLNGQNRYLPVVGQLQAEGSA